MLHKMLSTTLALYLAFAGAMPAWGQGDAQKKKSVLAVVNLDAKGVSQVEAEVISEKLRSHILQTVEAPKYRSMKNSISYELVERTQMDKIFEQFNIQNTGCVSDSCAVELGKMLGADRIIMGQVGLIGRTYSVSARIIDLESSKTLRSADRQYRGSIDELMNTVIVEIGNELLMGKVNKSKMKYYLLAGVLVAGAGAGAAMSGGGGGSGTPPALPLPPSRP